MTVGPDTGYGMPTGNGIGHGRGPLGAGIHDVLGSHIVVPPMEIVGRTVIGRVVTNVGRVITIEVLLMIGRVVITIGRVVRDGRGFLGGLGLTFHGVVLGPRGIVGLGVCHGGIDVRGVCQGMTGRGSGVLVGCLNGFDPFAVDRGRGSLGSLCVDVGRNISRGGFGWRVGTGGVIGLLDVGMGFGRTGVSRGRKGFVKAFGL